MPRPDEPLDRSVQPALPELFAAYLQRQVSRQNAGITTVESRGDVLPFEAAPVQPVDAELAWNEAVAVAGYFRSALHSQPWSIPPDWAGMVSAQEPAAALAFSFGNYPQLMRNLHALFRAAELSALLPRATRLPAVAPLADWAATARMQNYTQLLLTAGVLRLARQFDAAGELLHRQRATTPPDWQAAWANEDAALVWHRGDTKEALALWEKQAASVPVLFNRGMAALFLGKAEEAREPLRQAVSQLSEKDGWHHLGCLYLALAEMR